LSEPLVTVVVPVFDGERFLDFALESALAQDYPHVEIIVVDDGSRDGSAEVARRHRVRVLPQPHRGVAAARNAGIAASRGELLAFLDADDVWPANRLSLQVACLQRKPRLDFVLGRAVVFFEPDDARPAWLDDDWIRHVRKTARRAGFSDADSAELLIPHSMTVMARAEVFKRIGGFSTDYEIGEDIDWLLRAQDAGLAYEVLPHVLLHYRLHGTNTSYGLEECRIARFRVLRSSLARKRAAREAAPERAR
jgi:glycosyltransferase involved in cell wall biosynthesis